MNRSGEDELIAAYFAPLAGAGGLGLRDDAALFTPQPDEDVVITVDAVVAGVHFFPDDPPGSIAVKALGVNLSDLSAKGARPAGFVLSLALPDDWSPDWLQAFADGLGGAAQRWRCPLLGGDTVRTPGPLTLSVTAFGTVPRGRMVRRTGARPGDHVYVSGTIGDAALGLRLRMGADFPGLDETGRADLLDRYLHPRPRVELSSVLLAHAHAGMDVSDGLLGDAAKMLAVSGVSGQIDLASVPMSGAARVVVGSDPACLEVAVTGGDDYELLVSVRPEACARFESDAAAVGVAVTRIGLVTEGQGPLRVRDQAGQLVTIGQGSFSHF